MARPCRRRADWAPVFQKRWRRRGGIRRSRTGGRYDRRSLRAGKAPCRNRGRGGRAALAAAGGHTSGVLSSARPPLDGSRGARGAAAAELRSLEGFAAIRARLRGSPLPMLRAARTSSLVSSTAAVPRPSDGPEGGPRLRRHLLARPTRALGSRRRNGATLERRAAGRGNELAGRREGVSARHRGTGRHSDRAGIGGPIHAGERPWGPARCARFVLRLRAWIRPRPVGYHDQRDEASQ